MSRLEGVKITTKGGGWANQIGSTYFMWLLFLGDKVDVASLSFSNHTFGLRVCWSRGFSPKESVALV